MLYQTMAHKFSRLFPGSASRLRSIDAATLFVAVLLLCLLISHLVSVGTAVALTHSREELVELWRTRVQSILDQGMIPIIDLESTLPQKTDMDDLGGVLKAMDSTGVALVVLDGAQAPDNGGKGYRWGYGVHRIVNGYPDHFVPATNGGTNNNWAKQRGGAAKHFIDQTEVQVHGGEYPIMGEFEFRHYMSSSQCRSGKSHRDVSVPLISKNGHRLFALSQETGLAFLIHLEMEDKQIYDLEIMLAAYPGARVVVCHFGQIRHPERQARFSAVLVERLLSDHSNLYFDLSTGHPGRVYPCSGVKDTVLWLESSRGQRNKVKSEYRELLTRFSDRFAAGFDYGASRGDWGSYIRKRAANIRLIIRDLPDKAKHDICYRTAWRLLTGKPWE